MEKIRYILSIACCYLLAIVAVRIYDSVSLCFIHNIVPASSIGISFLHTLISSSIFVAVLAMLYMLISFVSHKVAFYITSVLASLLVIAEIGIDIFTAESGVLLGCELLSRPFSETVHTVTATVGWWAVIFFIAAFVFIVVFVLCTKKLSQKLSKTAGIIIVGIEVISLALIWLLPNLERKYDKPQVENYVIHKTIYFVRSCINDFFSKGTAGAAYDESLQNIATDESLLKQFIDLKALDGCEDVYYPMERNMSSVQDVLSPFFSESQVSPNVVILVVESLGREWSGKTDIGISYTPFIDSLAEKSLYWSNCLATTKRSFGAVPTITGSLPHGPRGFQFGTMPSHNSILSILKQNGYQTNAFYASDFTFDAIQGYLNEQNIDYMSSGLQQECFSLGKKTNGTYWGYHDEFMFQRSLEILDEQKKEPYCNLYITISAHDEIDERNARMDEMLQQTRLLISKITSKEIRNAELMNEKRIATIVYTDYALREFFKEYAKRSDYANTVFVITGDHSAEKDAKNRVGMYHVPLLIYSPLLKQSGAFNSLVTHADIAPSLMQLLQNKYHVEVPEQVCWISDGLDTSQVFCAMKKIMFMDYAHDIGEILYDNYFYYKEKQSVYEIDSCLNMRKVQDSHMVDSLEQILNVFKYVNNYVYLNNKLKKHTASVYSNVCQFHIDEIECHSTEKSPKEQKPNVYYLLKDQLVKKKADSKILKVAIRADMCITGNTWQGHQMSLCFACSTNGKSKQTFTDNISNFVAEEKMVAGEWYTLNISRKFNVEDAYEPRLDLFVRSNDGQYWLADNHMKLKNIEIYIDEQ